MAISVAHADPVPKSPPEAQPSIAAIRAFTYHHESGTFGTDDLIEHGTGMNMEVEGDGTGEATVITLIQVEIAVPDGKNAEGVVGIDVLADKKKRASHSWDLRGTFSDKGVPRRFVPLVVYDTACQTLTVNATLTPPKGKRIKKTATLDFKCGE